MPDEPADLLSCLLTAAAGIILLAGATIDLFLAFRFQQRETPLRLPAGRELAARPFAAPHALLVLLTTGSFVFPALLSRSGAARPSAAALLVGPLLYALLALLTVSLALYHERATFRAAFAPPACGAARALGFGLFYGLAAIPPVLLLSLVVNTVSAALGYPPHVQEVFDWLRDETLSQPVRVYLMAAAVLVAPLAEEALFRGILLPPLLRGRAFPAAALLSGLYFALVHLHAPSLLPLLALSVAFSAGYAATGSLLTPIVMHALFNATSLLLHLGG